MNFKSFLFIVFLLGLTRSVMAQVVIDNHLIFDNTADTARQFYNVSDATDSSDALTNNQLYDNKLYLNAACNGAIIELTTSLPVIQYENGMSFEFIFPACITQAANNYIDVNNLGNLYLNKVQQHDSIKYLKGKLVKVILQDNIAYLMPSTKVNKCPNGFVKINRNYCIQYNRNAQATFWNSIKKCADSDSHLCTPEEWVTACLYHNSKLTNMPLNWEWVDSGSNHNVHAPILGNAANCNNSYTETTATTGLPHYYRCCYRLK